jgi:hypothetical protein
MISPEKGCSSLSKHLSRLKTFYSAREIAGRIVQISSELEEELMAFLPPIIEWVEHNQDFTDRDLEQYKVMVPEHYKFITKVSFNQLINIEKKYRDHSEYGKYVEIILSEKGRKWLRRNILIIQRFSEAQQ